MGKKRRHFSAIVGWNSLVDSVKTLDPKYTSLVWNLKEGLDPDDDSLISISKRFQFLLTLNNKSAVSKNLIHSYLTTSRNFVMNR